MGREAPGRPPLTRRERQILGLLAEGMSGAQIAAQLVLSPETVRTHVRNAMAKLGATTRSQAVALALRQQQITAASPAGVPRRRRRTDSAGSDDMAAALAAMLEGLAALYDVDGGAVYLTEEDGLSLTRAAIAHINAELELPAAVALGDGALGRGALERRAQLLQGAAGGGHGALIAAPMLVDGRLLGMIALAARVSRPIERTELLLLQAFANRVGEIVVGGDEVRPRLEGAMERFRASWSAATRPV